MPFHTWFIISYANAFWRTLRFAGFRTSNKRDRGHYLIIKWTQKVLESMISHEKLPYQVIWFGGVHLISDVFRLQSNASVLQQLTIAIGFPVKERTQRSNTLDSCRSDPASESNWGFSITNFIYFNQPH